MNLKWNLSSDPFSIIHRGHPVRLDVWSAQLSYVDSDEQRIPPYPPVERGGRGGSFAQPDLASTEQDGLSFTLMSASTEDRNYPQIDLHFSEDPELTCRGTLANRGGETLRLEKLTIHITNVQIGAAPKRLAVFKHGYQSWSETRAFTPDEIEMTSILPTMMTLQSNPRNPPSGKKGAFTSDMYSVIGDLDSNLFLLIGQFQKFDLFFYVNTTTAPTLSISLIYDFGGKALPPGAKIELDPFTILVDNHPNRIQDRYLEMIERPAATAKELPVGWCSWYYYFSKVTQGDIRENLEVMINAKNPRLPKPIPPAPFPQGKGEAEGKSLSVANTTEINFPSASPFLQERGRGRGSSSRYFVLDDGYATTMGDWLSINAKFPDGLQAISAACAQAGWVPGIWIAPFVALRSSKLFREHPDWFLKDRQGKPVLAGWNPNWGLEGRFYGLDTTHPEYQAYLKNVIQTIVHAWGFRYLKLDFTYGASLYGRAYDQSLSPAERLKLGYRLIRATAGKDTFLLGCGSPISAAIGLVDAMRIGPDVAPYWFDQVRYHLTRDPHALCTRFAIRNTLNRAPFHRQLWLNDPDCLLMRDSDTQLSPEERGSLLNAIVISGGAFFLSDKLANLSPENWETIATAQQLGAQCDRGKTWALDYMEGPEPSLVYNSSGYLAVFNFADHATLRRVDLKRYLEGMENGSELTEVWSGKKFGLSHGILDLGEMKAHSSYLFELT